MTDLCSPISRSTSRQVAQRGVSLMFALVTLVALSLASVALIRSVDSGTLILGNLGFKQDTQLAADDAARTAITWLSNNIANTLIQNDSSTNGYYASVNTALDPTGSSTDPLKTLKIAWDSSSCTVSSTRLCPSPSLSLPNGLSARYVIVRLCDGAGDPLSVSSTIQCARPLTASTTDTGKRTGIDYVTTSHGTTTTFTQYYRILVRAVGPRNTMTFTETVVHF